MQTLQQELDPSKRDLTSHDHPVLRDLDADQAAAYAQEVTTLRRRVATLEAALTAAEATRDNDDTALPVHPIVSADFASPLHAAALAASEFAQPLVPAVMPVASSAATEPVTPESVAPGQPATDVDPGFATAWAAGEGSFEERLAEKAFFQTGAVDEQSRSWLLGS